MKKEELKVGQKLYHVHCGDGKECYISESYPIKTITIKGKSVIIEYTDDEKQTLIENVNDDLVSGRSRRMVYSNIKEAKERLLTLIDEQINSHKEAIKFYKEQKQELINEIKK
jgi:hypothetical protein